jgi:hypothetical protein
MEATLTCADPGTGQWTVHAVGAGQAVALAQGTTT